MANGAFAETYESGPALPALDFRKNDKEPQMDRGTVFFLFGLLLPGLAAAQSLSHHEQKLLSDLRQELNSTQSRIRDLVWAPDGSADTEKRVTPDRKTLLRDALARMGETRPIHLMSSDFLSELLGILDDLDRHHVGARGVISKGNQTGITGTVTDAGTGFPIANDGFVRLYDAGGSSLDLEFTDAAGSYSFAGLPAGTYFVRTEIDGYYDELYDDIPCPISCNVTTGTPIAVASGSTTSGIDFVLTTGGAITGTVTEALTGFPVADEGFVRLYDAGGNSLDLAFTDAAGSYTFAGLPTGTYFVRTDIDGYFDELYDDIPCPISCNVTTGTPIAVTFGSTTSGIDLVLSTGGAITGTVTDAGTGFPVADEGFVRLYDAGGNSLDLEFTDAAGSYTFAGLPTGTYFVRTDIDGYFDELYDDLPCPVSCDVTTGTPIAVTFGSTTSGIDLVLGTGGAITGTVTADGIGFPVADEGFVRLYDAGGDSLDLAFTDGTGSYTFAGLPTGTYFVRTDIDGYFDELYDGIPCPISCNVTTGTPIAVASGSITAGIDFVLSTGGAITGTVTDAVTGFPVANEGFVRLYDAGGDSLDLAFTDAAGSYTFAGLPTGTYFVRTDIDGYFDELYDDIPCPISCNVTTGTPIVVTFGSTITGIDLALGENSKVFEDGFESGHWDAWSAAAP